MKKKFDSLWRRIERLEPKKGEELLFGDPAKYAELLETVWCQLELESNNENPVAVRRGEHEKHEKIQ